MYQIRGRDPLRIEFSKNYVKLRSGDAGRPRLRLAFFWRAPQRPPLAGCVALASGSREPALTISSPVPEWSSVSRCPGKNQTQGPSLANCGEFRMRT